MTYFLRTLPLLALICSAFACGDDYCETTQQGACTVEQCCDGSSCRFIVDGKSFECTSTGCESVQEEIAAACF